MPKWIHPLSADVTQTPDVIGGKAFGLILLRRLGLPVPPGFVITAEACRHFLRHNDFPDGLPAEIAAAAAGLRQISVRSGAQVSMPGMMNTILDLDPGKVLPAVAEVFRSWDTPRARTYRELNDIPDDLGTAVTVQEMVYGDRDEHSGAGVAFSRDPNTGDRTVFGELLFGHHGEDVVSGRRQTLPLAELTREPKAWADLHDGLRTIEEHYRDACYVEFTVETGKLWFLQVRPAKLVGRAAVRVAVDLADEGAITRSEAVSRVAREDLKRATIPRMVADVVQARGLGACPGVTTGKVATTADQAVRMAAEGPVILVRPFTSPLDMHGLAAAAGVVTAKGGPASHAAVVARAMGKPAVVGVGDLGIPQGTLITIDGTSGEIALGRAPMVTGENDPYVTRLSEWSARPPSRA
ncbi:MAG: PEP/pyruvate-binding domain-containing protein [Kibdelosporangium sp.]